MKRIDLRKNYGLGYASIPDEKPVAVRGNVSVYISEYDNGRRRTSYYLSAIDTSSLNSKKEAKVVIQLYLEPIGAVTSHEVVMAMVDKKYQGFNIAAWAYKIMLKKIPNLIIQAGRIQSPGGRHIWTQLARYKDINISTLDRKGVVYDIEVDEMLNELSSPDIDLYDGNRVMTMFARAV